ncbi:MAG TPA: hypothetical protein VJJ21_01345 [Candidatus Nanoarchaeia archaeon]|nr:hypothetical protein [Candidatus Nanoarchaeia archaeon]
MAYDEISFTVEELRDIAKPRTWLRTRLVERTKFTPQLEAQLKNAVMDKVDLDAYEPRTSPAYQREVARIRREIGNILYQ